MAPQAAALPIGIDTDRAAGPWATPTFVPLRSRPDEWQARVSMVREARRFLYLSTYFIEHDAHGLAFLDELCAAAQRGVQVFLGLDALGQKLGNYKRPADQQHRLAGLLHAAAAQGVRVGLYRPRTALQRRLGAGHHVKLQLSDAGTLLLGSSNLSTRSFDGWHEFSALMAGPIVVQALRDLQRLFGLSEHDVGPHADLLARSPCARAEGGAALARFDYLFHDPNPAAGRLHPLRVAANPITDRLVAQIDAATRRVRVSSFHCKPTRSLADALVRAARRGVRVELFHSHRAALPDSVLPWLSAAFEYDRFLRAGIHIHESRRGEHAKLFLVDDRWAAFGSYNAEHAAHERLAELMVMSSDPRIVGEIARVMDTMAAAPDVARVMPGSRDQPGARGPLGLFWWRPLRRWI